MRGDEDASASAADHARARLGQSRLAILAYLRQSREGTPLPEPEGDIPDGSRSRRWADLRAAGRRYWERHPARLATRLLAPALAFWGRRHPLAFIALALVPGALLILARPWRLVSVTGLALAALKSPHLASLLMSALASFRPHARHGDRAPP